MELIGEFTLVEIESISQAVKAHWICNGRPIAYIARSPPTTRNASRDSVEVGVSGDGPPGYDGVRTFRVSLAKDNAVVEGYIITFGGI